MWPILCLNDVVTDCDKIKQSSRLAWANCSGRGKTNIVAKRYMVTFYVSLGRFRIASSVRDIAK